MHTCWEPTVVEGAAALAPAPAADAIPTCCISTRRLPRDALRKLFQFISLPQSAPPRCVVVAFCASVNMPPRQVPASVPSSGPLRNTRCLWSKARTSIPDCRPVLNIVVQQHGRCFGRRSSTDATTTGFCKTSSEGGGMRATTPTTQTAPSRQRFATMACSCFPLFVPLHQPQYSCSLREKFH